MATAPEQERARRRTAGATLVVVGVLMVVAHLVLSHAEGSPLYSRALVILLVVVGAPLAFAGALVWRSGRPPASA